MCDCDYSKNTSNNLHLLGEKYLTQGEKGQLKQKVHTTFQWIFNSLLLENTKSSIELKLLFILFF